MDTSGQFEYHTQHAGGGGHGRMGTLWLRGAEGLICPKFYT